GRSPSVMPDVSEAIENARSWAAAHVAEVVAIGSALFVVGLALGLLVLWFGCRGQVMAVHAVARADARVGEAWRASRGAAWSLFRFRVALGAVGLVVGGPLVVLGGLRVLDMVSAPGRRDLM